MSNKFDERYLNNYIKENKYKSSCLKHFITNNLIIISEVGIYVKNSNSVFEVLDNINFSNLDLLDMSHFNRKTTYWYYIEFEYLLKYLKDIVIKTKYFLKIELKNPIYFTEYIRGDTGDGYYETECTNKILQKNNKKLLKYTKLKELLI